MIAYFMTTWLKNGSYSNKFRGLYVDAKNLFISVPSWQFL